MVNRENEREKRRGRLANREYNEYLQILKICLISQHANTIINRNQIILNVELEFRTIHFGYYICIHIHIHTRTYSKTYANLSLNMI